MRIVINYFRNIGKKFMKEHEKDLYRQKNYEIARTKILESVDEPMTKEFIVTIHALVEPNLEHGYRTKYGNVPVLSAGKEVYSSSTGMECTMEMNNLLNDYSERLLSVDRIITFHWKFVKIHPFGDGNGRTARLLMLWQLLQNGFDENECKRIENLLEQNKRTSYYDALNNDISTYNKDNGPSEKFLTYMNKIIKAH